MKKVLLLNTVFLFVILWGNDSAPATSSVKWIDVSRGVYSVLDEWDWPRPATDILQALGLQHLIPDYSQNLDGQVQGGDFSPLVEDPETVRGTGSGSNLIDVFVGIILVFLVFIVPPFLVVFLFRKLARRFHRNRARKPKRPPDHWIVPTEASEANRASKTGDKEASSTVGGQPKQRHAFWSMYEWRNPLLVGLCLLILIVLFLRNGDEDSTEQIDSIIFRLEKFEAGLLSLDNDIHQLQQSVVESERSVESLSERVNRLSSMTIQTANRMSSADGEAPKAVIEEDVQKDGEKRRYHEVCSGDTLYQIAKRNNMSVEEICRINEIDNSLKITVGQKIFLE